MKNSHRSRCICWLLCLPFLLTAVSGCTAQVGLQTSLVLTTKASSSAPRQTSATAATAKSTVRTTATTATTSVTTTLSAQEQMRLALDAQLAEMTVEQKVGQLFVASVSGTSLSENDRAVLRDCAIGNVILFGENIGTLSQLAELNASIRETVTAQTGIEPLIGIDQEGGLVERIKDAATAPRASVIGATGEPALAKALGTAQGAQLYTLGINLNFAPVADVNTNPDNPVIGSRSYGADAQSVAQFVTAYVSGLQSANVLACVKHFPGHGDTSVDSHYSLPTVEYGRERLEAVELVPFRAAIAEGAAMVMVGHILYPALGAQDVAASLSQEVVTGVLREELGYEGLIITDSLTMGAVTQDRSTGEACVMAIEAGADLLCVPLTGDALREAWDAVMTAVESGRIPQKRLDASVRRILETKQAFELEQAPAASAKLPDVQAYEALLDEIEQKAKR